MWGCEQDYNGGRGERQVWTDRCLRLDALYLYLSFPPSLIYFFVSSLLLVMYCRLQLVFLPHTQGMGPVTRDCTTSASSEHTSRWGLAGDSCLVGTGTAEVGASSLAICFFRPFLAPALCCWSLYHTTSPQAYRPTWCSLGGSTTSPCQHLHPSWVAAGREASRGVGVLRRCS